jgi:L-fuculokinase
MNHCLVFDIGKTNKKALLFDENYEIVWQTIETLAQTIDDDGHDCESIELLTSWITNTYESIKANQTYNIKAVNFSAYGASFVYLNEQLKPISYLYNYLKPYPESLQQVFYNNYDTDGSFSAITASPKLGSLNSGLQLYRTKYEKKNVYSKIKYALHLPNFCSFILTNTPLTEITSIGSHTALYNFNENKYHNWVQAEGIDSKFAPIRAANMPIVINETAFGSGLHDSSAALEPYLASIKSSFLLLSTGTWSICLNPFSTQSISNDMLANDCLTFFNIKSDKVLASRYLLGKYHENFCEKIAEFFKVNNDFFKNVKYNEALLEQTVLNISFIEFSTITSVEKAYHLLMQDIVNKQIACINLVIEKNITEIYVDGGFANNHIFMILLAAAYPNIKVYAAKIAQASATGAAMVIHKYWNSQSKNLDVIKTIEY